jgi:TonB family protein
LPPVEVQPAEAELNLLLDWDALYPHQYKRAGLGSLLVHLALLALFVFAPASDIEVRPVLQPQINVTRSTPLYAPRMPESVRGPKPGQAGGELTLDQLLPRKEQPRPTPPKRFELPTGQAPLPQAEVLPEPPPPTLGPDTGLPQVASASLPPAAEKPKLAFENPGTRSGTPQAKGQQVIPKAPTQSIDETMRTVVRARAGGGIVVTDIVDLPSGADATLSSTPQKRQAGSSLELLSDPQGVDFKPYLIRVLASVRRNWFAVIPESVKYGQRGRVIIQFAISRQGSVPKLVISAPSGTDSLDRAAVAGISASNPFPPLPPEFKGDQIRLQLSFLYNMPVN